MQTATKVATKENDCKRKSMDANIPDAADLKQARIAQGMSMTELSRRANIHPKTVSRAEKDLGVHVHSLVKIVDVLTNN